MADITPGQYQITRDDGTNAMTYGFGANAIHIVSTAVSPGSITTQDQAVVGHDGVLFGVDTQAGAILTQDGICKVAPGSGNLALDAYDALAAIWNDPAIRLTSNRYQVLRMYYRGSNVIRRVYGRGRAITATYGQVFNGLVPWTAQFQCADNNVYEDAVQSVVVTAYPVAKTPAPVKPPTVVPPIALLSSSRLFIGGTLPTWPVIAMTGPITNPLVTFTGTPVSIGYTGSVPAGQSVVIDTRPWARTILLNGLSVAGALAGSPFIAMQLWPGTVPFTYGGTVPSGGASSCTISWSNVVQALGGSA